MAPQSCIPWPRAHVSPTSQPELLYEGSLLLPPLPWGQEFPVKPQIWWKGCEGLWGLYDELGTTGLKGCFEDLPLKKSSDGCMGFAFRGSMGRKKPCDKNDLFCFDCFLINMCEI